MGRTGLCSFDGGFHCCKLADRTCNGRKWSEENMAGFVGCMEFIPDVCFKYLTFVLSNVELLLHRNIADIEISLPLGISFLRSKFSVIFLISIMGTQRCRRIVISLRSMCLCSHNWWQDLSCVMNRLRMRLTTGRRIWRIFPSV